MDPALLSYLTANQVCGFLGYASQGQIYIFLDGESATRLSSYNAKSCSDGCSGPICEYLILESQKIALET